MTNQQKRFISNFTRFLNETDRTASHLSYTGDQKLRFRATSILDYVLTQLPPKELARYQTERLRGYGNS